MSRVTRRDFLKSSVTAGALAGVAGSFTTAQAARKSATDMVPLGNSGIEVTRLALGTGTFGGRIQRELPQEEFTKIVRHAYDRGIRFFESADNYAEMHEKLALALKGIPRDSYKLMTKMRWRGGEEEPKAALDRFRQELNSDYFDIVLIHCVRTPNWPEELQRLRDEFSEAKQKKIMLAHGASVHGLLPLRAFPRTTDWLDVALLRINHDGTRMDTLRENDGKAKGDVSEVVKHLKDVRRQGTGIIGMKIMGEGAFTSPEQRDASIKFVTGLGAVDSMTIGFKNTAEVDEAIALLDKHLNA